MGKLGDQLEVVCPNCNCNIHWANRWKIKESIDWLRDSTYYEHADEGTFCECGERFIKFDFELGRYMLHTDEGWK